MILKFSETLGSYEDGFKIIFEPYYDTGRTTTPLL